MATGSGRRAARHPAFEWANTALGNIKCAIVGTYRAVRRKHISRTLAEFEWRFNHRTNLAAMIPILGYAAVRTKPATYGYLKWADLWCVIRNRQEASPRNAQQKCNAIRLIKGA